MSSKVFFEFADRTGGFEAEQRSRRANRRRLIVFLSVFALVALVGLIYVFSRPAVYEATARLNFVPVQAQPADDPARASDGRYSLRDEVQYMTSTALLAQVWDRLKDASSTPVALKAGDPPATLQSMLTATQVPGTNVVSLQARGGEPAFLSLFLDRLVAAYRASLGERYASGSSTALAEAGEEVAKLDANVATKRQEVDAFRARNNIVSLERDENQVLSEVKGVGASLNAANEKVVAAEAKLGALKEAEASGQSVTRAKDNPTLAAIEQQAVGIRADLRETARTFTAEYMAIDPRIKALRARLTDLEEQMVVQRKSSQQGALQEAREEVAGARAAVATLRQQLATNQHSVQAFTSQFNAYKALQEEVTHLEQLRQKAADRLAVLDAGERGRMPKVEVVEAASTPQSPSSPLYARDAALALIAALIAGLLTMGIVEFFNRPPQQPATVVVPQQWGHAALGAQATALPSAQAFDALPSAPPRTAALAAPTTLPRELTVDELDALLRASEPEVRGPVALLLLGLAPAEVVALRSGDVDREGRWIRVPKPDERILALPAKVLRWLPEHDEVTDAPLFEMPGGRALAVNDLDTALLYAAHDAGIDAADDVTPQALRHTYIAFLVRQGLRFAELARIVGPLPADRLAAYKRLAAVDAHPADAPVERVLPVLQDAPA